MIKFTVLSQAGKALRTGTCSKDTLSLQAGPQESVVEGWVEIPVDVPVLRYTAQRCNEYPSIGEQLDMLWHSMNTGEIPQSKSFFEAIQAVKIKHPKV